MIIHFTSVDVLVGGTVTNMADIVGCEGSTTVPLQMFNASMWPSYWLSRCFRTDTALDLGPFAPLRFDTEEINRNPFLPAEGVHLKSHHLPHLVRSL